MDPSQRLHEIQDQIARLSEEARLLEREALRDASEAAVPPNPQESPAEAETAGEGRVWGVWLGRLVVILATTAMVLAAGKTVNTAGLAAWQKVAMGYGLAAGALAVGLLARTPRNLLAHLFVGAGLVAAYFTSYAAFYVPEMQIFASRGAASPALAGCLIALAAIVYWRQSQTAAVMLTLAAYYTVLSALREGVELEQALYALGTCAMLAAAVLVYSLRFRWRFVAWLAALGAYTLYIVFFWWDPDTTAGLPETARFWLLNGTLTACYLCFALTCVVDIHRRSGTERTLTLLAAVNSLLFFAMVWGPLHAWFAGHVWALRAAFAAVLGCLALLAETHGPRRNYLFQLFIAKTVVMGVLVISALFDGAMLWVAMATICLALTVLYHRTGAVILKAANLLLLLVTFVGAVLSVKAPGMVALSGWTVPANWLCAAGVAGAFVLCAVYHEVIGRRLRRDQRKLSGQWFLADSLLDPPGATVAMLHAAAAALVLLTITIIDQGDSPSLPYLLAAESIVMALAGVLLFTPQLEVGSVLLLVAAHVSFYFFMLIGKPGFEQQESFVWATAVVAAYTFLGGLLWERYLRRIDNGRQWEHNLIAPIPYLGAVYMVAMLIGNTTGLVYEPLAYNVLGAGLLLLCVPAPYAGLRVSGLVALGVGTAVFSNVIYNPDATLLSGSGYLLYLLPFLATFTLAERLLLVQVSRGAGTNAVDGALRTLLVAAAGALGILAFNKWADEAHLTLYWLAHGMAGVILGFLFREPRYRWASALILGLAVLRAVTTTTTGRLWAYQVLAFGGLSALLFAVHWYHARTHEPPREPGQTGADEEPSLDG